MAAIPKPLALALRDLYGLRYVVETGTYKMWSTEWLADQFEQVWTIEMDEKHYSGAIARAPEFSNVHFVLGDSRVKLRHVLEQLDGSALLWLDAHWCAGADTENPPEYECPLREELIAIKEMKTVHNQPWEHFVLIDDAEYFMGRPRYPHRIELWPSLTEIISLLPDGYIASVWRDTIVAAPARAQGVVMAWMQLS